LPGNSVEVRFPPYRGSELADRWSASGWRVLEMDGHNMTAILEKLDAAGSGDGRPIAANRRPTLPRALQGRRRDGAVVS